MVPSGLTFYESFTIHFVCCLIGPGNHMPLHPFPGFYDCDLYKQEFLNNLMEGVGGGGKCESNLK